MPKRVPSKPPSPDTAQELVVAAYASEPFSKRWSALGKGQPVALEHVAREAFPFAAALSTRAIPEKRIWLVCADARTQEQVHGELHVWGVPALFFPRIAQADARSAFSDPDTQAERISVLARFAEGGEHPRVIVLCEDSLDEEVTSFSQLDAAKMPLHSGMKLEVEALLAKLVDSGYERVPVVAERGHFARRGGILDVFSWQGEEPLRIEFADDTIESLRTIDIHTQTSVNRFDRVSLLLHQVDAGAASTELRALISPGDAVVSLECDPQLVAQASDCRRVLITAGAVADAGAEDFSTAIFENPLGMFEAGDFVLHEARRAHFTKQVEEWRAGQWRIVMFLHNEGERDRFEELAGKDWIARHDLQLTLGLVHRGFVVPSAKLAVLTGAEIFGRHLHTRRVRGSKLDEAQVLRQARDHLREMREGDLVVHEQYGIGKFTGIEVREGDRREEVMVIRYADDSKLFVPVAQAHLVSRYVGVGGKSPTLNKLGDAKWTKTRATAERSVEEFAARMLSIAAQRTTLKGHAHSPDTKWQVEFEQSFLYRETPDQLRSIEEIKRDMEMEKPMDRLLCGDVGFGKTEVAIRAAFKAVMGGRQVAVLVPTTVLAQQHWHTFRERMSDYPVTVEMLSRLTPPRRVKEIIEGLREGTVDIVVGTHRVISKDVRFKNLGLAVVDEEQRFGVKHKEKFKELFRLVDVLTLSATPIPRTLYLGLMGMRDMSTLDTPPPNRIPVQTTVLPYDERVIRDAIDAEVDRGGQVFFLHNRVMDMEKMQLKLENLCPKARILVGHGQMADELLEDVMQTFVDGKADVLLCTTIIESGVDIPNANTIIIDRADRFGLADLYQLRGRVGRAGQRAHAYLMLPRDVISDGDARKRVNAIKQYTALGSGFKIAMRDLEIRGAGNLLGTEQSGHIIAVGFDLYCQMLKAATAKMQGGRATPPMEVSFRADFLCMSEAQWLQDTDTENAPKKRITAATAHRPPDKQRLVAQKEWRIPAYIPQTYIEDPKLRITAYRMLGEVMNRKDLDALSGNWRDQFGRPPPEVENLLVSVAIKLAAAHARISAVEIKDGKLMLTRHGQPVLLGGKFPRLTERTAALQLRESLQLLRSF